MTAQESSRDNAVVVVGSPQTSGFAIASFICGLVGPLTCGITSILALVFGLCARAKIRQSRGGLAGRGFAIAGVVLGILGLVVMIILPVLWLGVIFPSEMREWTTEVWERARKESEEDDFSDGGMENRLPFPPSVMSMRSGIRSAAFQFW